jgi:hypothetical protein
MPKELQPHTVVPACDSMSPGEKQAWLLNQALDVKREILSTPLPDPYDDSIEANRMRSLLLSAADSTIGQAIQLKAIQSGTATSDRDAEMEKIFEERQRAALLEIERLRAGGGEFGGELTGRPRH